MIRYNPRNWFSQIFRFAKSDTFRILWKEMLVLAFVSYGLCYAVDSIFENTGTLRDMATVYSLIGFVLSLLLVFRTNTAYDRWWEGRKKWGELVNTSRNLALKVRSMTKNADDWKLFKRMIPNYAFALKEHLRSGTKLAQLDISDFEKEEMANLGHPPNYLAQRMYNQLDEMKREKRISEIEFLSLDANVQQFTEILGACERIRNTPMPFSYNLFLKKFIFIYVVSLPIAFFHNFNYWTILIAVFIFYVLVSIEILAEEIEDPFGEDDNDLPTENLSQKIRANIHEILRFQESA